MEQTGFTDHFNQRKLTVKQAGNQTYVETLVTF